MARLVLDTNVFVAGLLSKSGPPARLLDAWYEGTVEIVISESLLDELASVLSRPKFRGVERSSAAFLDDLRRRGSHVSDPPPGAALLDDPTDEFLVQLALAADADALVSGDAHLTVLPASVCRVLTPRQAVELFEL